MIIRLLTFLLLLPVLATAADKPNIIIVLADDMGIGDLTPSNPDCKIKTPHLQTEVDNGRCTPGTKIPNDREITFLLKGVTIE